MKCPTCGAQQLMVNHNPVTWWCKTCGSCVDSSHVEPKLVGLVRQLFECDVNEWADCYNDNESFVENWNERDDVIDKLRACVTKGPNDG